ncbi:UNVERIFIED_CONTAM: IQ domain-containing protein IQM2 [Sesamum calycinum]|uniref:IQ domain-containing protein IQM2 n=1 Tax=Sesamum calycinum TaxID=2727403 RepID=A0AAW2SE10_9LAMI
MGVSCSCPLAVYCDLENGFESVVVKSIDLGDGEQNKPVRSISKDSEPKTLQSLGSGKLSVEGSIRFRARKTQTMRFTEVPAEDKYKRQESFGLLPRSGSLMETPPEPPVLDPCSPKHEAAIKLQKVYKSFRTRRKLADCAVLIEQSWWKLLDFAELKHSSISFFDIEKHETAISRWSRARTRAAKVGKGLSKNGKAQKLALQHWLEALDLKHFSIVVDFSCHTVLTKWLWFYRLDIGEGKEVNLIEKCPRSKLQQQCIKYLGPMERKAYEVAVENGKLFYRETGELLDTTKEPKGCKWIFVLSTSRTLYVGKKKKGSFQHSSFLAGGATLAAGRIVAENGVLKAVWPHSGHYRPTHENFQDFISFLRENNVDLADVKLDSTDDEEESSAGKHVRNNSSEDDLMAKAHLMMEEIDIEDSSSKTINSVEDENAAAFKVPESPASDALSRKLSTLQIPSKDSILERLKSENEMAESTTGSFLLETAQESFSCSPDNSTQQNNVSEEQDETKDETISEESIFQRISSHKGMKSYQLGKQLSCRWSTGAGPRIGCLRDYPSGLQCHALEQVNLSPRSKRRIRVEFSSRASTPTGSMLSRSDSHNLGGSCHL